MSALAILQLLIDYTYVVPENALREECIRSEAGGCCECEVGRAASAAVTAADERGGGCVGAAGPPRMCDRPARAGAPLQVAATRT